MMTFPTGPLLTALGTMFRAASGGMLLQLPAPGGGRRMPRPAVDEEAVDTDICRELGEHQSVQLGGGLPGHGKLLVEGGGFTFTFVTGSLFCCSP